MNYDNDNSDARKEYEVYVILSQTMTMPARLIKFYTKKPYAHASIAFDEHLDEMYSFARRGIWNPFNAGFISEDICAGIFGKYEDSTMCSIYRVKLTKEQYERVREIVGTFVSDRMSYSYSYLGLIGVAFNYPVTRNRKFFCSQFVAYVLKAAGVNVSDKIPALTRPEDLRNCEVFEEIYVGKLSEYRTYLDENRVSTAV